MKWLALIAMALALPALADDEGQPCLALAAGAELQSQGKERRAIR